MLKAWEFENHEIKSMEIKKDGEFRDIMVGELLPYGQVTAKGRRASSQESFLFSPGLDLNSRRSSSVGGDGQRYRRNTSGCRS